MDEGIGPLKTLFLLFGGIIILYIFLLFFGGFITECVLAPDENISLGVCTIDKINFAFNNGFENINIIIKEIIHFLSSSEGLCCQDYKEPIEIKN